jgi:hypothetical protein
MSGMLSTYVNSMLALFTNSQLPKYLLLFELFISVEYDYVSELRPSTGPS